MLYVLLFVTSNALRATSITTHSAGVGWLNLVAMEMMKHSFALGCHLQGHCVTTEHLFTLDCPC